MQSCLHGSRWRFIVVSLASKSKPLVLEDKLWYFGEWMLEACTGHGGEAGYFSSLWLLFHSARRQVWASGTEGSGSLDSTLVTVGMPNGRFLGGQQG